MNPRRLHPNDLEAIDALLPADWPPYRKTFERYFDTSCCQTWGFFDGELVSMGTLIGFGNSACLAQIITAASRQRQGWGTRMVEFLIAEAQRQGTATLSLVATEQGFPLYQKAGFREDGGYGFWSRLEPAPAQPAFAEVVPWSPEDSQGIVELDFVVSGERREPYLGRDLPSAWVVKGAGYFLPSLGEGLVVASTPEAGTALLHKRLDGTTKAVVPIENPWAGAVLTSRGFAEHRRARRMIWGPPLGRKPQWCWSRIGGNLG